MKKLKKAFSLILALVLPMALTVPAFAADLTGPQLYPNTWGNGPSLALKGVTGEHAVETDPRCIYDVAVGGSLELDMPYPAGTDRVYIFNSFGIYATPDYTTLRDDRWNLPEEFKNGMFDPSSGKTKFVYTFTEADMGQQNGFDKIFRIGIFWSDVAGGYTEDGDGSVCFGIHVVPASAVQPQQPAEPVPEQPAEPAPVEPAPEQPATPNDPAPVQPTQPTTPATPDAPGSYTVKKGDTWSSICTNFYGDNAQRYALQKANKGVKLKEGAVITLPEKLGKAALIPAPVAGEGEKLYTVKAGDTLGKIAANQYGKVSEYKAIFERNADRLKNANTIYVGQVIVLPAKK